MIAYLRFDFIRESEWIHVGHFGSSSDMMIVEILKIEIIIVNIREIRAASVRFFLSIFNNMNRMFTRCPVKETINWMMEDKNS